jgi:hypothetical protein
MREALTIATAVQYLSTFLQESVAYASNLYTWEVDTGGVLAT